MKPEAKKKYNHKAGTISQALGISNERSKELYAETMGKFLSSESLSVFMEKMINSEMNIEEIVLSMFNFGAFYSKLKDMGKIKDADINFN